MKQAVAVSYNWKTQEILFTPFDGDGCVEDASNWVNKGSFLWIDFPESKGWVHFYHANKEAIVDAFGL